jgi:hypothetical protein
MPAVLKMELELGDQRGYACRFYFNFDFNYNQKKKPELRAALVHFILKKTLETIKLTAAWSSDLISR